MTFKIIANNKNRRIELQIKGNRMATVRGIRQALFYLGRDLKFTANKNILIRPRFGREEIFRGRRRRASVPGESFANRTGAARRQLGFFVKGADQLEFGFRSDALTTYTKTLEEKFNRPTLRISTVQNQRNARKHFEFRIKKAHQEGL